jgi:hypothetical protein
VLDRSSASRSRVKTISKRADIFFGNIDPQLRPSVILVLMVGRRQPSKCDGEAAQFSICG